MIRTIAPGRLWPARRGPLAAGRALGRGGGLAVLVPAARPARLPGAVVVAEPACLGRSACP
eukprot:3895295-Pyramimonas_sp.AAC.1